MYSSAVHWRKIARPIHKTLEVHITSPNSQTGFRILQA